jgi:hypothetical protein
MGKDGNHWFWMASIGAAGAVVLGIRVIAHSSVDVTAQAAPAPSVAAADASTRRTQVTPTPTFAASGPAATVLNNTIATVYECDSAGQRAFSDRRCAPNASERAIEAPSRMDRQDTRILSDPVTVEYSRQFTPGGDGMVDNTSECAAIQAEIDAIDAHMRGLRLGRRRVPARAATQPPRPLLRPSLPSPLSVARQRPRKPEARLRPRAGFRFIA